MRGAGAGRAPGAPADDAPGGAQGPRAVQVRSQRRAEAEPAPGPVISITSQGEAPARIPTEWPILRVVADDVPLDAGAGRRVGGAGRPFSPGMAGQIAAFVRDHVRADTVLLVHCGYGVSRSAGVALGVADALAPALVPELEAQHPRAHPGIRQLVAEALRAPVVARASAERGRLLRLIP